MVYSYQPTRKICKKLKFVQKKLKFVHLFNLEKALS